MPSSQVVPIEVRFWRNVTQGDGCWGWLGATDKDGYGRISESRRPGSQRRQLGAHRVSWMLHNGPIPDDMWVLHHCDNPPCTNPAHLYLGTVAENNADIRTRKRRIKAQWTHCQAGHEFTPENTRIRRNGCRTCRACARAAARLHYYAKKAAA